MMSRGSLSAALLGSLILGAASSLPGQDNAGPVVVALRPRSDVRGPLVLLGDVADLRGGDVGLRARLAKLDLAEGTAPVLSLQRDTVEYRILLAGVAPHRFRVHGLSRIEVRRRLDAAPDQAVIPASAVVIPKTPGSGQPGPYLVRGGQPVLLRVSHGAVRITMRGEALQNGRVGDVVRVRNTDSRQTVIGTVAADGVVEVRPLNLPAKGSSS